MGDEYKPLDKPQSRVWPGNFLNSCDDKEFFLKASHIGIRDYGQRKKISCGGKKQAGSGLEKPETHE